MIHQDVAATKQELLDKMAGAMMRSLTENCGVHFSDEEWYRLREKIADLLRGEIRI